MKKLILPLKAFSLLILAQGSLLAEELDSQPSAYQMERTAALGTPTETTSSNNDAPSSPSEPLDLPQYEDLEQLMLHMEELHQRSNDRNPTIAQRAADQMEPLIRASFHERLAPDDPRYQSLAKQLHAVNDALRRAIPTKDRRKIDRAFQAQARACAECHQALRPKE